MNYRAWQLKTADAAGEQPLAAAGYGPLLARVLAARGVTTPGAAAQWLEEQAPLSDPFLLKDMERAVERIQTAVENGEPIVIFGDYDVDG
ncbi:single-stranded-DNA-specific exonuclease RecJ, partial [bacterium]|nr:single-stranded-DNA-specific exonuclease RecJ [bacterium]